MGDAYSLDATPDVHEILVDTVAPEVRVSTVTESNQTKLDIREIVSADRTMVRYRFDNGAFSEWMPSTSAEQLFVPEEAESIEVEGSHCGLGHHPAAIFAIADRLAQPEGTWAPFQRSGLRSVFFPNPKR